MINTTRIQSTVRQLAQFDAAVANFYTKYNQIPGDTSVLGIVKGDNNNFIGNAAGMTPPTAFTGEVGKFWADLSASGLKTTGIAPAYADCSDLGVTNGCLTSARSAGDLVNTYIPATPMEPTIGVIAYGTATTTNWFELSSFSTLITSGVLAVDATKAFKGADAAAIDAKIDDGVATTGNIHGTTTLFTAVTLAAGGTAYDSTTPTPTTNLIVRLGLQTGHLQ